MQRKPFGFWAIFPSPLAYVVKYAFGRYLGLIPGYNYTSLSSAPANSPGGVRSCISLSLESNSVILNPPRCGYPRCHRTFRSRPFTTVVGEGREGLGTPQGFSVLEAIYTSTCTLPYTSDMERMFLG